MSTATHADFPADSNAVPVVLPAWKNIVSHAAAAITAILFLAAGLYKMLDPFTFQTLAEQLMVPVAFSLPLAIGLGVGETLAGVLVLIPRYRRWGALLATALLLVFMGYVGARYNELLGRDCSCFPWLKRTVGPGFFIGDVGFLVASVVAAWFSRKLASLMGPLKILGAVIVLSGAAFGYNVMRQSGVQVPANITVDGKPYALREGRVFLFFYDPACSHCEAAAKDMSTYKWTSGVTIIGLPTNDPQWAASFIRDTKINARTSFDTAGLRKLFSFPNPPYAVALDHGRVKENLSHFDEPEPEPTLKRLGFIE